MELTQLLYFKAIAESNNMSLAAEKLHISQPALSTALKKLEEELNVRLFERNKNKITLNDSGKIALTYAESILNKADEMKNTFRQYIQENRLLSLGFCDPGPMRFSVPLFQKAYQDVDVTSGVLENEENIANLLLSHKYDAVISLTQTESDEITSTPFAKETLLLSVPEGHN